MTWPHIELLSNGASPAPKQLQVLKTGSRISSMFCHLIQTFPPLLVSGMTWEKKGCINPTRDLTNDAAPIPEDHRHTVQRRVTHLDLKLGQIGNYCPIISRKTITHNSVSIDSIW